MQEATILEPDLVSCRVYAQYSSVLSTFAWFFLYQVQVLLATVKQVRANYRSRVIGDCPK